MLTTCTKTVTNIIKNLSYQYSEQTQDKLDYQTVQEKRRFDKIK